MKKFTKKMLSLIVVVTMVFTAIIPVTAYSGQCEDYGLEIELEQQTVSEVDSEQKYEYEYKYEHGYVGSEIEEYECKYEYGYVGSEIEEIESIGGAGTIEPDEIPIMPFGPLYPVWVASPNPVIVSEIATYVDFSVTFDLSPWPQYQLDSAPLAITWPQGAFQAPLAFMPISIVQGFTPTVGQPSGTFNPTPPVGYEQFGLAHGLIGGQTDIITLHLRLIIMPGTIPNPGDSIELQLTRGLVGTFPPASSSITITRDGGNNVTYSPGTQAVVENMPSPLVQPFQENAQVNIPQGIPRAIGYAFQGWLAQGPANWALNGISLPADTQFTMPAGSVTLTAQWLPAGPHNVTFARGYASANANLTVQVLHNATAEAQAPTDWIRIGYTFNGWLPATFTPVTGERIYTAQWQAVQPHDVTFARGYASANANLTVQIQHNATAEAQAPTDWTRIGYIFNGWLPTPFTPVTGPDRVYTAQWLPAGPHNVTFARGYASANANLTVQVLHNATAEAHAPTDWTRIGYTFNGWLPTPFTPVTGERTYTAQWLPAGPHNVTFARGYASANANLTVQVLHNATAEAQAPTDWTRIGYTFNGWSPATFTPVTGPDRVYTAQWLPAGPHNVTFARGYASANANLTVQVLHNATAEAQAPTDWTRIGYTFNGWSPATFTPVTGPDRVYTAQWLPAGPHNVTFARGYASANANLTVQVQHNATAEAQAPTDWTRIGYTFNGWLPSTFTPVTGERIYTAQWLPAGMQNVTFARGYASANADLTVQVANNATAEAQAPTDWTRIGYTFNGWLPAPFTPVTGPGRVYTAQWLPAGPHDVTFARGYASANANLTVQVLHNATAEAQAPTDWTRGGYIFNGWLPAPFTPVTGPDRVYTAQWLPAGVFNVTFLSGAQVATNMPANLTAVSVGSLVNIPAGLPLAAGYTFLRWELFGPTSWPLDNTPIAAGDTFTMPAGNVILIAQWQAASALEGMPLFREQRAPSLWFYHIGANKRNAAVYTATHGHFGTSPLGAVVFDGTDTFTLTVSCVTTQVAVDFARFIVGDAATDVAIYAPNEGLAAPLTVGAGIHIYGTTGWIGRDNIANDRSAYVVLGFPIGTNQRTVELHVLVSGVPVGKFTVEIQRAVQSINVGTASSNMIARSAVPATGSTVTYSVTTSCVPPGEHAITVNTPTGVSAPATLVIGYDRTGTLTLTGSAQTAVGTHNNLVLTIDLGATTLTSNTFTLNIVAPGVQGPGPGNNQTQQQTVIEAPAVPLAFIGDHISFVRGFPDGSFRPGQSITRAEVSMILWRLLDSNAKYAPRGNNFSDVNVGWYAQAVSYLAFRGIVTGYPDGTFRPNAEITRAELTAMMSRFFEMDQTGANNFADVSSTHWAINYINNAFNRGWVEGDGDGGFRPDAATSRAEAVAIMNRVLGRIPNSQTINYHLENSLYDLIGTTVLFNDITNTHWAFYQIMEAAIDHDFDLDAQGREVWTNIQILWF